MTVSPSRSDGCGQNFLCSKPRRLKYPDLQCRIAGPDIIRYDYLPMRMVRAPS